MDTVRPRATYGRPRAWHRLYVAITAQNCGLRDQLRALHQAAHQGADAADVEAVQFALFAAHGGTR